jgi:hypothetical protein
MNFDGNFRSYGRLDEEPLRHCVDRQPPDAWTEDPFRQEKFNVHTDTQALYLVYDQDFRHVQPTRHSRYAEFSSAFEPFIDRISESLGRDGWIVRCILAKLCGGGRIALHKDRGYSLTHAHRFHIPVITNPGVGFTVGTETIHMQPGEIWEINNTRPHGAENRGPDDRVHLIVDWARPFNQADLQRYIEDRQKRQAEVSGT